MIWCSIFSTACSKVQGLRLSGRRTHGRVNIVSRNGFSPIRCNAITSNNAFVILIGPVNHISVTFESNINIFHPENAFNNIVCKILCTVVAVRLGAIIFKSYSMYLKSWWQICDKPISNSLSGLVHWHTYVSPDSNGLFQMQNLMFSQNNTAYMYQEMKGKCWTPRFLFTFQ